MKLFHPLRIGDLKLNSNILLAPLDKITNFAYIYLCMDYGAGIGYIPIVNENFVVSNKKKFLSLFKPDKRPIGIQLIGKDPKKLSKAAKIVEPYYDIIDLNFGCPKRREVASGVGAVLLKEPKKIKEIVSSVVNAVSIPVTAKIRLGFDTINVIEVSKIIEEAGASAITVHARTAKQDYDVPADWSWIKKVKEELSIPVIGNGDIFKPEDVKQMLTQTKCDGVMIGREADPLLFENSINYLKYGTYEKPNFKRMLEAFKNLLKYEESLHMYKVHAIKIFKNIPNVRLIRSEIIKRKTKKDLLEFLHNFNY